MENINTIKVTILSVIGVLGGIVTELFGGWDSAMTTLIMLMAIDYIMGLVVAGVFHKSKKSENGALNSKAGWKGLCKKGGTLLIVLIAVRLDMTLSTNYIKNMAIIGYIFNEGISILENAELMGIPIPSIIRKALDILQSKTESDRIE